MLLRLGMLWFFSITLLVLALLVHVVNGVKLTIADSECVEQYIKEPDSLVSVVLVAGHADDIPVYFDFVVCLFLSFAMCRIG